MIRKFKYFFAFLMLTIAGCQGNSFEEKIADQIEKSQSDEKSIVNIKKLTDFDWDKMYVFDYTVSDEDIFKILKTSEKLSTNEFTRKIIFMKGNKVILCDSEPSDIENVTPNEVRFPTIDSLLDYSEFTPGNAIFSASIRKSGDIKYYQLWQVSDSTANNK